MINRNSEFVESISTYCANRQEEVENEELRVEDYEEDFLSRFVFLLDEYGTSLHIPSLITEFEAAFFNAGIGDEGWQVYEVDWIKRYLRGDFRFHKKRS